MTKIGRDQIEAQYLQSTFVKEVCMLGEVAVVVPDLDLLRRRRIANIGDLLRFELEGQAMFLPADKRACKCEIWFEPLPRTATGDVDRDEVARRLQAAEARKRGSPVEVEWIGDSHATAVAEVIRRRSRGRRAWPDANLEIDLALDSMDRVDLMTELEHRFGVRIPHDCAHEILTLAQLIEAVRPREGSQPAAPVGRAWAVLLNDLPSTANPALKSLVARRPIAMTVFYALSRLLRLLFGPGVVEGRHHLPRQGPYIITPNHACYLDPFIVSSALPYRVFRNLFVVGAAEYFETPLMSWLARKINLLPVDPDANLVSAMQASALGLQHGKVLILFPEGERSIDGTVKRFKKGATILAQHLGVPIVPVAIRGAFELWPRNRPFNWRALLPFGHHVRVAFGPPMRFDATADYGESAAKLRAAVDKMWSSL
jgi:long-chain acyl-CoA synthetase